MDILSFVTFFVAFISSIFSGIAGGGGGFVMAPYWLAIGMSPAQASATGSFMACGMSMSSVAAFRNTNHFPKSKTLLTIFIAAATIGSLLGALIVPIIDMQIFKYILATVTIAALPLLFIKPNVAQRLASYRKTGTVIAVALLIIGSVIMSSAFSVLFALALVAFFRMPVLQMTALRRVVGVVQSVILFIGFAVQGYFVWQHAIAGVIGGSIGSYIGTKIAIKKGESFAKYALAAMSLTGAIALLL